MAGEWIKMRNDLAEDPAVIAIAQALGDVDEDLIVGKLHRLWSWADRQSRDGHATGVTGKWIDRHVRCDGFSKAMVDVNWLRIDPAGISFPNFDRHNGETAKTRALGTKRKQKSRAECPDAVPELSRPDRDKSGTREEKRREEKKEQEQEQELLSLTASADKPTDLQAHKAERLAAVTMDASLAYNEIMAKPKGLLASVRLKVGAQNRQNWVRRVIRIAREICEDQYKSPTITREFWDAYFNACAEDPWLRGEGPYVGVHANWRPDFEVLTRPDRMLKVFQIAVGEDAA